MSQDKIEKDISKAQQEFIKITSEVIIFFNLNGMPMETIKQMLHESIDNTIKQIDEVLKK